MKQRFFKDNVLIQFSPLKIEHANSDSSTLTTLREQFVTPLKLKDTNEIEAVTNLIRLCAEKSQSHFRRSGVHHVYPSNACLVAGLH